MPRGMLVHEIFSSQSQPAAKKKAEGNGGAQNGGMASKKTPAPMPPMKRFGGYKPKILAGEDIAPSTRNEAISPSSPTPLPPPTSPPRLRPVLTKPKPFIIGDKDVPMVLDAFGDSDGSSHNDSNINGFNNNGNMDINSNNTANNDRNNYFDSAINDLNIYDTVEDIGTKGVDTDPTDSELDRSEFPRTNGIEIENSNFDSPIFDGTYFDQSVKTKLIDANNRSSSISDFATENPAFINETEHETKRLPVPVPIPAPIPEPEPEQILHKDNQADDDLNEIHIPEPDYDEKEEILDFTEEDPDTLPEYNQSNEQKFYTLTPLSSRVYYGEDYSQYLSDDDDDPLKRNYSTNGGDGGGRREVVGRLSEKHSMFKYPANADVPKHAASKHKGSIKSGHNSNNNNNNSVRSFSYADSKCGTKGKAMGKTLALKKGGDEAENFHDDSYESFLFSRHGHTMPARIPAVNPVQQGGQRGGDDKLWKKLTYRLRNKRNKNGYALSEVA